MTPYLLPFTRALRPMRARSEVGPSESCRILKLGLAVKSVLFNVETMSSLSTARHNSSSLHETTIERPQNAWSLTDTAATVPRDFSHMRRLKAVIWTVSDCLLMVVIRRLATTSGAGSFPGPRQSETRVTARTLPWWHRPPLVILVYEQVIAHTFAQ